MWYFQSHWAFRSTFKCVCVTYIRTFWTWPCDLLSKQATNWSVTYRVRPFCDDMVNGVGEKIYIYIFPCGFQGNAFPPLSTVRWESWYRAWILRCSFSVFLLPGIEIRIPLWSDAASRLCEVLSWKWLKQTSVCFSIEILWGLVWGDALFYFMTHWSVALGSHIQPYCMCICVFYMCTIPRSCLDFSCSYFLCVSNETIQSLWRH